MSKKLKKMASIVVSSLFTFVTMFILSSKMFVTKLAYASGISGKCACISRSTGKPIDNSNKCSYSDVSTCADQKTCGGGGSGDKSNGICQWQSEK